METQITEKQYKAITKGTGASIELPGGRFVIAEIGQDFEISDKCTDHVQRLLIVATPIERLNAHLAGFIQNCGPDPRPGADPAFWEDLTREKAEKFTKAQIRDLMCVASQCFLQGILSASAARASLPKRELVSALIVCAGAVTSAVRAREEAQKLKARRAECKALRAGRTVADCARAAADLPEDETRLAKAIWWKSQRKMKTDCRDALAAALLDKDGPGPAWRSYQDAAEEQAAQTAWDDILGLWKAGVAPEEFADVATGELLNIINRHDFERQGKAAARAYAEFLSAYRIY